MISIIIISKNDKGLDKTLDSLLHFIKKPAKTEIIVVDASAGKLDYIRDKYPEVIWIMFTNPIKKRVSIPRQRNIGIENAKGDVIVFTDASCVPTKDWLEILFARHQKGEMIVAGQVVPSDSDVINNISARYTEQIKYVEECPTANVLIDKKVFSKIGNFDEDFEYGSDTDFMWRARDNNFKIYYEQKALITHDWGTSKQQFKRSYQYGRGRMLLYLKHKNRIAKIASHDPILVFYPPFLLFLPIIFFFPYYILLLLIPLIKNRNEKRPFDVLLLNLVYGFGGLSMLFTYTKSKVLNL